MAPSCYHHLKFISSGCYHALLITLPLERTLRAGTGQKSILSLSKRQVSLKRMKIHEDLVFDKNSCQLVGFTNLGEVNDQSDKFNQLCLSENEPKPELICSFLW